MKEVLSGAVIAGLMVAGLFFLRFWSRTRDGLFLYFSIAFWVLALQRLALAIAGDSYENNVAFYVVRLLAFVLIIIGIWQKNVRSDP